MNNLSANRQDKGYTEIPYDFSVLNTALSRYAFSGWRALLLSTRLVGALLWHKLAAGLGP